MYKCKFVGVFVEVTTISGLLRVFCFVTSTNVVEVLKRKGMLLLDP
jgi:hypothetical protein